MKRKNIIQLSIEPTPKGFYVYYPNIDREFYNEHMCLLRAQIEHAHFAYALKQPEVMDVCISYEYKWVKGAFFAENDWRDVYILRVKDTREDYKVGICSSHDQGRVKLKKHVWNVDLEKSFKIENQAMLKAYQVEKYLLDSYESIDPGFIGDGYTEFRRIPHEEITSFLPEALLDSFGKHTGISTWKKEKHNT